MNELSPAASGRPTSALRPLLIVAVALSGLLTVVDALARVDRVTVYPDRATVERIEQQNVGPESDRIRFEGLPVGLDRDSLRVRAEGPEGLRIGAVEFEPVRGIDRTNPAAQRLEQEIENLERERTGLADRIAARELQLNLLQRVVTQSGDGSVPPADLMDQLNRLGENADRIYAERRTLLDQQTELNERIQRAQRELADLGKQQRDSLAVSLAVEAPQRGQARFTIEYTVGNAFWRPVYEWRLDTVNARLDLVQSAELRQSTGEDWTDADVSFSLARPASGGQLPQLTPWWIDVITPRPELERRQFAEAPMALDAVTATGSRLLEATPLEAGLETIGLTQRYDLPGRVSVPADNRPRRFRLDEHRMEASLTARAVPQRRDAAWTFMVAEWTGEAALPPGPVQLFQDGATMGRMQFGGAAPGSPLEASFGVDDRIELDVELVRQDRRQEGLINKSIRETREYRWTVTNRHQRPIALTLLANLPVARDERIEIEMTDRSDEPDRRDIDEQPGLLGWDLELGPGESREIVFGTHVRWPADLEGVTGW
jgi:uncharacterized protein (TIGR02231 family)